MPATIERNWTVNGRPILGADDPALWPPTGDKRCRHAVRDRISLKDFAAKDCLEPDQDTPIQRQHAYARPGRLVVRFLSSLSRRVLPVRTMKLDDVVWNESMGEPAEDPPTVVLDAATLRQLMKHHR